MFINRLLLRTARKSTRDGFTLVELLVVIGIIAILAGVALGPITNGIRIAKHNASMQTGRQLGQVCFAYSTDNTANGNSYPAATTATIIAQNLINANYVSDPSIFVVSGQTGVVPAVAAGGTITMASSNVSWSFTVQALNTLGGVTSTTSDLIPLIFFNASPGVALGSPFPAASGGKSITLATTSPFALDGIAVFYKGNNAEYLKAGTGGTPGVVSGFISASCLDTTTYLIAP